MKKKFLALALIILSAHILVASNPVTESSKPAESPKELPAKESTPKASEQPVTKAVAPSEPVASKAAPSKEKTDVSGEKQGEKQKEITPTKSGNGTAKQGIRIGHTGDLTRGTKDIGKTVFEVTKQFFDEYNEQTRDASKQVQLTALDDEYSAPKTKENVEALMSQSNIDIFLSILGADNFGACLDLVKQKKIAAFFPIPGIPEGCPPDLKNCVIYRPSYVDEAYVLVRYLIKKFKIEKPQDLVLFYQADSFGNACLAGAQKALKEAGMAEIDHTEKITYMRNDLNFAKAYEAIKSSKARTLVIFATPLPAEKFLVNADASIFQKNIGCMSLTGLHSFQNFIKEKNVTIVLSNVVPNPANSDLPIAKKYREFIAKFNLVSSQISMEAYINASLLADIIGKTSGPINKESLIATVEKEYKNYTYAGLKLNLDSKTRNLSHSIWIASVGDIWTEVSLEESVPVQTSQAEIKPTTTQVEPKETK